MSNLDQKSKSPKTKMMKIFETEDEDALKVEESPVKKTALEKLVFGGEEDVVEELNNTKIRRKKKKSETILSTEKTPAWIDKDDDQEILSHGYISRYGKRKKASDLRAEFESISKTPNWAVKREHDTHPSDSDSDVEELRTATGNSLRKSSTLPKGTLDMKRCIDANHDSPHGAKLRACEFHPNAQVMLTAGMDQRLSLFQVDGKVNPLIQSTYFTHYPIHTAHFSADGNEAIVGSIHASFYYYDLIAGKIIKVPKIKAVEESCMRYFEVSPDGKFLAFRGKSGFIHLISAKSKEWISSLKMNGTVSALTFSKDGSRMFSHGSDSEVYIWDMNTRDCIHRFYDDGCIHGTSIRVSPCRRFLATGSNTGVVNVYETDSCLTTNTPRPVKSIMNLTTTCTSLAFNSSSEILALASNAMERAIRLFHMPSLSTFSNFPDKFTDKEMRIPICLDFSTNSGFFTVGSHKGIALLYRLKHYGNY